MTQIPRPSFHEEKIRRYVLDVARSLGLECREDAAHNVYVRKPASKGMENRAGVILQAHLDMVPQKNNDKKFDFMNDPIRRLRRRRLGDGRRYDARGRQRHRRGGDPGRAGGRYVGARPAGGALHGHRGDRHGRCVRAEKRRCCTGDILLNLDSETEGELYVGCAGGLDANDHASATVPEPDPARNYTAATDRGQGVSRAAIRASRSSASAPMPTSCSSACCMPLARKRTACCSASVDGGGLRNAIPREADGRRAGAQQGARGVPRRRCELSKRPCRPSIAGIEEADVDQGRRRATRPARDAAPERSATNLIRAVAACPDGVQRMSTAMPGLVQTSTNLARVVSDGSSGADCNACCAVRSIPRKMRWASAIAAVFALAGRQDRTDGRLRRLEPRHGVADPEGDDRFLRGSLRQASRP